MNGVNWKNLKSSGANSLVALALLLTSSLSVADYLPGDIPDENVATLDYPTQQGIKGESYSFAKSKYALAKEVYSDYFIDFYGGCKYQVKEKLLVPIWNSCGFTPRKNPERAKRIEWEHVVPAWTFGHQLKCWQNGGRANCRNTNAKFRQMEADMHNLVPAIGEINGDRSNFAYGMIAGEPRPYGKPNAEIDFNAKLFEPDDKRFGDVARSYLYMRDRYGFKLSRAEENLMLAWNNLDPVDEWEQKRNERIAKLQGNDNPYISHYKSLQRETNSPTQSAPNSQPDNNLGQGDWFDKLYQWVNEHQNTLPFPIVLLVAVLYWWFRGRNTTMNKKVSNTAKKGTKK
ncbi:MAG: endonuclease [Thiofilum sp.]|uniref:endonuclease n=1 Tax=Thiofilum sp. TaxID=2212733 RepID=UPI0025E9EF05|nr:endonuclease [Thiofilum sp.]MBK8453408.1 endonuclease [Thiofilum sp.]